VTTSKIVDSASDIFKIAGNAVNNKARRQSVGTAKLVDGQSLHRLPFAIARRPASSLEVAMRNRTGLTALGAINTSTFNIGSSRI
jgi:hypothetical protein